MGAVTATVHGPPRRIALITDFGLLFAGVAVYLGTTRPQDRREGSSAVSTPDPQTDGGRRGIGVMGPDLHMMALGAKTFADHSLGLTPVEADPELASCGDLLQGQSGADEVERTGGAAQIELNGWIRRGCGIGGGSAHSRFNRTGRRTGRA